MQAVSSDQVVINSYYALTITYSSTLAMGHTCSVAFTQEHLTRVNILFIDKRNPGLTHIDIRMWVEPGLRTCL